MDECGTVGIDIRRVAEKLRGYCPTRTMKSGCLSIGMLPTAS